MSRLMIVRSVWISALLLITSLTVFSQGDDQLRVVNDPLFWRNDLRLTKKQVTEIENANADFYSTLREAMTDQGSNKTVELSSLLLERSNSIWNLLSPRQKAKWLKIEQARYTAKGVRRMRTKFI